MLFAASGSVRCHAKVRRGVPTASYQGRQNGLIHSAVPVSTPGNHRRGTRGGPEGRRDDTPVRCSASAGDGSSTKDELSPGGSRMVDGNRPTSPKAWEAMYKKLTENKVRSVSSSDIEGLKGRGATIIDVRPETEFDAGHIDGSLNVSLYQPIVGNTPKQILRKAGYAFFGIFNGTEANENFECEMKEAVGDFGDEIVVICNTGGSLESSVNFEYGKQSRSLMAAYEMVTFGYQKIRFLEGGYNQWRMEDRPANVMEQQ